MGGAPDTPLAVRSALGSKRFSNEIYLYFGVLKIWSVLDKKGDER